MLPFPAVIATLACLGAAGTVTGSKFVVAAGGRHLMLDCGLFQGVKALRERNRAPLPLHPADLACVVLTHAHIDHIGYLPRLGNDGFGGRIYATRATADLARIMLPDSGHLPAEALAERVRRELGWDTVVPGLGDRFTLD